MNYMSAKNAIEAAVLISQYLPGIGLFVEIHVDSKTTPIKDLLKHTIKK